MSDTDQPSAARPDDDTQPLDVGWPSDRKRTSPEPSEVAAVTAPEAPSPAPAEPAPAESTPAEPAPAEPAPAAAWASPAAGPAGSQSGQTTSFSPTPEPPSIWARSGGGGGGGPTPESWFEPAPAPVPTSKAQASPRAASSIGIVVVASLLSAILGAGGTYLALNASGVLNRAPAAPTAGRSTSTQEAARFDESSAVVEAAAKVSLAVVQITSSAGI